MVVLDRRCTDQLVGKYSQDVPLSTISETMSVPKSNQRGENDFGVWAYMKQIKPSFSAMALEGNAYAMFLLDRIGQRFAVLRKNDPAKYSEVLTMARQRRGQYEKRYGEWDRRNQEYAEKRMETVKRKHEESKKKEKREQEWKMTTEKHGECKTKSDVRRFKRKFKTKTLKIRHLNYQIMYV